MSKFLKSGSVRYPALLLMVVLSTYFMTGCGERGENEPPINMDTVKPHVIPIALAASYTRNFRNLTDTFIRKLPELKDSMNFGYAEAFPSDLFRVLLKQKDSTGKMAAGVRIYYGRDSATGRIKLVLVPYDHNNNDIINHLVGTDEKQVPGVSPAAKTETLMYSGGQAGEQGQLCPTLCSAASSPLVPPAGKQ